MSLSGPMWEFGAAGERAVQEWLRARGFYIVPTTAIQRNGAPRLESNTDQPVLPDLQVSLRGHSRWVEIKTKSEATFTWITRRWEHGVLLRHWEDYLAVERQSGIQGWLAIYELKPDRLLLLQTLAALQPTARPTTMKNGPHMFFARDHFQWYEGPHDELQPIAPKAEKTITQPPTPKVQQGSLFDAGGSWR